MKNLIKPFLDELGITPYRFWHDTGISRVTAYKLCNDPTYIPGADVLVRICDTYMIQPGVILVWVSDDDNPQQGDGSVERSDQSVTQRNKSVQRTSAPKNKDTRSILREISELPETA